jgi:hypothetical protein
MNADLRGKIEPDMLKQAGIDKVIIRSFKNSHPQGGLYFQNSFFNVIYPYLDELAGQLAGNESKLELWAWMISRKFDWTAEERYFDYKFTIGKNGNGDGERQIVKKFDLFNPDAIQKIIGVYKELAKKGIQGILIQDDLFFRHNEGFSNWGKAHFTTATSLPFRENLVMAPDTPYSQNWNRLKINQINKVLQQVIAACKGVNPNIKIGMNIYYETPFFIERSEKWYSHNLREILLTGIDHIYLMSYHRQMKKEMKHNDSKNKILFKQIVESAFAVCGDKLVVKLQLKDWETGDLIPVEELRSYLELIPKGVKRACFMPVDIEDLNHIRQVVRPRIPAAQPQLLNQLENRRL